MNRRPAATDHAIAPPPFCFLARLVYFRAFTWACALLTFGLLLARALALPLPNCPLRTWTGRPCPTCGLTRSVESLLKGNWQEAVNFHPFGPLLLVLGLVSLVGSALPAEPRRRFIAWLTHWEMRTRSGWILLGTFVGYGVARFVF